MDHRADLTDLERRLLDTYQQGLPLSSTPYADMAQALVVSEADVLTALTHLQNLGVLSRVGPVFRTHAIGASTLAAMAVPEDRLEAVAAIVNSFAAVNHNYEREHRFNLWFVATAASDAELTEVLEGIEELTNIKVMPLPMLEDYHIDLGFTLQWT
ncbi:MAG TPA: Lrp/AsnC family transcriptional regulator [Gammaproteobacteria bacterium]|jgi:DNA-binding Lrp family transcriptional regulator|nr:Lrp/AsnC family transcriptional regulator [Gammaproteobacteria bacterium]